jgi:hypothetical protein
MGYIQLLKKARTKIETLSKSCDDKDKRIQDLEDMLTRFLPAYEEDELGNDITQEGAEFHWNEQDDSMIYELKELLGL